MSEQVEKIALNRRQTTTPGSTTITSTEPTATSTSSTSTPAVQTPSTATQPSSGSIFPTFTPTPNGTNTNSTGPPEVAGVSSGAAGGIAVGCLLAGVALGVLAAFFFFRRKRRTSGAPTTAYASVPPPAAGYGGGSEKAPMVTASSASTADGLQLGQFLAAPQPDAAIVRELRALGDLIQQHVDTYYHQLPAPPASTAGYVRALAELGVPGRAAERLAQLASMPQTRLSALQEVIARGVFGAASVDGTGAHSLLPATVMALNRDVAPVERVRGNQEGE
jgi:hypothetical protein